MMFRSMVKQCLFARNGFHATLIVALALKNLSRSGWHRHQSVVDYQDGEKCFYSKKVRLFSYR